MRLNESTPRLGEPLSDDTSAPPSAIEAALQRCVAVIHDGARAIVPALKFFRAIVENYAQVSREHAGGDRDGQLLHDLDESIRRERPDGLIGLLVESTASFMDAAQRGGAALSVRAIYSLIAWRVVAETEALSSRSAARGPRRDQGGAERAAPDDQLRAAGTFAMLRSPQGLSL